jgi:hypothetical protein
MRSLRARRCSIDEFLDLSVGELFATIGPAKLRPRQTFRTTSTKLESGHTAVGTCLAWRAGLLIGEGALPHP